MEVPATLPSGRTALAGGSGALLDSTIGEVHEVLESLKTQPAGLSLDGAEARLARDGPNLLPTPKGPSLARQFGQQLTHGFALMLWVASILAFVARLPELGWAIAVVVLVNGSFSFLQEYRAERATQALGALLPERALVLREGRKQQVPAEALVRGDVVLLREGDRVSADVRIIESHGLKVDNSSLTGESEPLERRSGKLPAAPGDVLEADNVAFAGTFVTSGSGTAVVVATGAETRLGGISALTGGIVRRPSPLQIQLGRMVRVIGAVAVAAGVIFFLVSLWM